MSRPYVNTHLFSPIVKDGIPPEDSMYYSSFYKENINYILNGYSVGDVKITGDHYWFLNFWKIRALNEKTGRKSILAPRFLEMQYEYLHHLDHARKVGKNMILLKRRQIGATELHAAIGGKEFSFFPGSQTVYIAGLDFYTDQLLNNTSRGLNDLFTTEFYKRRNPDQQSYMRAAFDEYVVDREGLKTKVTRGFMSEVYGITAKNNPQAASSRCFGEGTPVLMSDGSSKFIEDICIGDKVMGPDGEERTVNELHQGESDLYEIDQTYGDSFIVNKDHLLYIYHIPIDRKTPGNGKYVTNNFTNPDVIPVDESHYLISVEDYVKKSKTFKRYSYHEKADRIDFNGRLEEPYFIGLWLGDGSSDRSEVTTMDAEIVEYLYILAFRYGMSVKVKTKLNNRASSYYLSSAKRYKVRGVKNQLHKLLEDLNIFRNKHISDKIKFSSVNDRLQFLAGLIDSDGTLSISRYPHYSITNKHKYIADEIVFIARSLGFHSTSQEGPSYDNKGKYCGLKYQIYISGDIWDIPCKIKRKQFNSENLPKRRKALRKTSFECNFIGKGRYYGFSCDKDQLFLLSDFTIVHNSPSYVIFEEAGVFPGVRQAYNFVKPSLYSEGKKTGLAIFAGTGGVMGKGAEEFEYIYYHPQEYDALEFDLSEFDEDVMGGAQSVGYFIPDWKYWIIDKDGNNLKQESIDALDDKRAEMEGADGYNELVITMPRRPSDSFMLPTGGYFGKRAASLMNKRRSVVMTHKELMDKKRLGNLHWITDDGVIIGIEWEDDPAGHIEIYEHPLLVNDSQEVIKNESEYSVNAVGRVPDQLYYIGTDSYDKNEANSSTSKGACIVRKGFYNANETSGFFCAKVYMREEKAYNFYENTAKLTYYYNGQNLIEWSNVLIFDYYHRKNYDFLLMERPDIMISRWIINSTVNNQYGIDPSSKKDWLAILKQQLKEPGEIDKMLDLDLLKAFINFKIDPQYNCDLTIAASLCMVQVNEARAEDEIEEEVKVQKPVFGFKRNSSGIIKYCKS